MNPHRRVSMVLWLGCLLSILACVADGGGTGPDDTDDNDDQPTSGRVVGRVRDAQTSAFLSGAIVSIGNVRDTTGIVGDYWLEPVPAGSQTITSTADRYHAYVGQVTVVAGDGVQHDIELMPRIDTAIVTATEDAFVIENSSTNFGSNESLFITQAHTTFTLERKTFVGGFNLSAIPPGVTIESAKLFLQGARVSGTGGVDITVQRALDPWFEATLNWTNMPARIFQSGAGTTTIETLALFFWYSWDVTVYIRRWVDGTAPNYGLALIALNNNGAVQMSSTEWIGGSFSPYLEVVYR